MFKVELGEGCHGQTVAPVVSEHDTLSAALDVARKSDRLVVVTPDGVRYQIPQQDPRGRLGKGVTKAQARALGWPI